VSAYKLTIAYDGTDFAGWQVQVKQRTVQGELERTIERVSGQTLRVTASGRTDAGVHALEQVAAFELDTPMSDDALFRALNAESPRDLAVLSLERTNKGFDPIRHAVAKRYRYVLDDAPVPDVFSRRYVWHVRQPLDVEAMRRAAAPLVGKHDFSSFESSGSPRADSVRTVSELSIERGRGGEGRGDRRITLEIEADGFLYNMVRAIVGTLVEVGRGAENENFPAQALAAKNRSAAGPTAPPQGLFLVSVTY
jgi:tRNA pseudouridine38-40 synthase